MRYYKIIVVDPGSGQVVEPPGFSGLLDGATYSSYVNGATLPAAWNVELDVPEIDAATPQGFALARVWGISLAEIAQANNLAGKNIQIFGGMQKGLPLANPAQSGLLISGLVFQCFGNWIGADMTLDFVISPGSATASDANGLGTLAAPRNYTLNWGPGQTLSDALKSCLSAALPGYTANVNISADIVSRANDAPVGYHSTLQQLAQVCRSVSLAQVKTPGYAGVSFVPRGNVVDVFDGTATSSSGSANQVAIQFQDLIGQPTWIESPNIQFKTVMRADLKVGQQVTLPQTITTNQAQANSSLVNQSLAFQGGFRVVSLRHVGNYRQPSADAWVTVVEAAPLNVSGTTPGASASPFGAF